MTTPPASRVRSALLAAFALVAVALAVPTAAQAASSPEYLGVNMQPLVKDSTIAESRWPSFLQPLQDGGVKVARHDINWFLAEPKAPVNGVHTYTWNTGDNRNSIDFQMGMLARYGIRAQPTFTGSPGWAHANGSRLPDAQFQNFTDWAVAFVERYGPNGQFWKEHPELPYLPTYDYEIWNEVNSIHFWTAKTDPPPYARLLQYLYPRLKAAQPDGFVLASIGWPDANSYLDAMWANGAGNSIDGIAFHPYAPTSNAIVGLTTSMRAKLTALGRGDIPIQITETGQPASYTGPGAQFAYQGMPSDAARAANQMLSADALARSDCNVNQFLIYAITGSETDRENIGEGYMGVLRYADGSPNTTGLAMQRASLRWARQLADGSALKYGRLALCSAGETNPAALLPLELAPVKSGNTCVGGTVRYDGNPLEAATLVLSTPDGRVTRNDTDAFGKAEVCIKNGPEIQYVDVWSEVPKTAKSAVFRCSVPITGDCALLATLKAKSCIVNLRGKDRLRYTAKRTKVARQTFRATLNCNDYKTSKQVRSRAFKLVTVRKNGKVVRKNGKVVKKKVYLYKMVAVRKNGKLVKKNGKVVRKKTPIYRTTTQVVQPKFTLSVLPKAPAPKKGQKPKVMKEKRLKSLTLKHGKTVEFTIKGKYKRGDQIILWHAINAKKDALPGVRQPLTLKKPLAFKAPKKKTAKKT